MFEDGSSAKRKQRAQRLKTDRPKARRAGKIGRQKEGLDKDAKVGENQGKKERFGKREEKVKVSNWPFFSI